MKQSHKTIAQMSTAVKSAPCSFSEITAAIKSRAYHTQPNTEYDSINATEIFKFLKRK
jgi:hypothetical protein